MEIVYNSKIYCEFPQFLEKQYCIYAKTNDKKSVLKKYQTWDKFILSQLVMDFTGFRRNNRICVKKKRTLAFKNNGHKKSSSFYNWLQTLSIFGKIIP